MFLSAISAALRTPRVLAGNEWRALLETNNETTASRIPRVALSVALRSLSALAMFSNRWQTSCLYRSVTACLALRGEGVPAVLKLGAKREEERFAAHAWVEDSAGKLLYGEPQDHIAFGNK